MTDTQNCFSNMREPGTKTRYIRKKDEQENKNYWLQLRNECLAQPNFYQPETLNKVHDSLRELLNNPEKEQEILKNLDGNEYIEYIKFLRRELSGPKITETAGGKIKNSKKKVQKKNKKNNSKSRKNRKQKKHSRNYKK